MARPAPEPVDRVGPAMRQRYRSGAVSAFWGRYLRENRGLWNQGQPLRRPPAENTVSRIAARYSPSPAMKRLLWSAPEIFSRVCYTF